MRSNVPTVFRVLAIASALVATSCRAPAHRAPSAPHAPCACEHPDGGRAATAPDPAAPTVPGRSVYQLASTWETESGATVPLAVDRGHPTLVLMFYGTCRAVCPLLIGDLLRVEAQLPADVRPRARFLLVTFDPDTDTVPRLRALARERGLDLARWSLLRGRSDDVRDLAMALGMQYRPMGNGQYSHSNLLTLLDADGVVSFQLEGVAQPVDELVARVSRIARGAP